MKILFAGDLNFRGIDPVGFDDSNAILSEVKPYLTSADFRVVNLETPLARKENHRPIKKSGPNLIGMPENIAFLKAFGADAVTLANNHIGDFGEGACADTILLLDETGIAHCGAGENTEAAYRACYFQRDGKTTALISVCENEFGMATDTSWGSAGYEPHRLLRQIREEKDYADYVIVAFHGGNEFNPLPSPATTERYRLICDMGADAVIAGHTHCPQGYEIFNGKPIVYSMGNLLFKSSVEKAPEDAWHYGYLCLLEIGDIVSITPIPYRFSTDAKQIHVFDGEERDAMLAYLDKLNACIADPVTLARCFEGWSILHPWCPRLPNSYDDNTSGNFNLISCEAHCDQLRTLLSLYHRETYEDALPWVEKIKELQKMPI